MAWLGRWGSWRPVPSCLPLPGVSPPTPDCRPPRPLLAGCSPRQSTNRPNPRRSPTSPSSHCRHVAPERPTQWSAAASWYCSHLVCSWTLANHAYWPLPGSACCASCCSCSDKSWPTIGPSQAPTLSAWPCHAPIALLGFWPLLATCCSFAPAASTSDLTGLAVFLFTILELSSQEPGHLAWA